MALRRRARLRRRCGLELRDHPKYGVRFGGDGRVPQAEKDKVNAKAALVCAAADRHLALCLPATQLAPSTPPRSRRAAAEVASRATKRDALADSPSRAPAHPKKTRTSDDRRLITPLRPLYRLYT